MMTETEEFLRKQNPLNPKITDKNKVRTCEVNPIVIQCITFKGNSKGKSKKFLLSKVSVMHQKVYLSLGTCM